MNTNDFINNFIVLTKPEQKKILKSLNKIYCEKEFSKLDASLPDIDISEDEINLEIQKVRNAKKN